jgi:hypothetical protein
MILATLVFQLGTEDDYESVLIFMLAILAIATAAIMFGLWRERPRRHRSHRRP